MIEPRPLDVSQRQDADPIKRPQVTAVQVQQQGAAEDSTRVIADVIDFMKAILEMLRAAHILT